MLRIGVPREAAHGENRVALVPETVGKLVKVGLRGAGRGRCRERGLTHRRRLSARPAPRSPTRRRALYAAADVVLKVREPWPPRPPEHEADLLREGSVLIGFLNPARNAELISRLAARRVTAFAMELIPRTTRAQKMDALSSMSTVGGLQGGAARRDHARPVLPAAHDRRRHHRSRARVRPRRRASRASRRSPPRGGWAPWSRRSTCAPPCGRRCRAWAPRSSTSSSPTRSGGRRRLRQGAVAPSRRRKERELIHKHVKASDVVITTALVPGTRAPAPDHRGDGARHAARLGDRGPGGRDRRQLRADQARRGRRGARRDDPRPAQPRRHAAGAREPDVLAQHARRCSSTWSRTGR